VTGKIEFDIPGVTKEQAQPVGIRMTADGRTAFVALGPANRVAVVDTATKKVERYLLRMTAVLGGGGLWLRLVWCIPSCSACCLNSRLAQQCR
jgi:hypothetical protein